jgi:GH15 family glucan-1,4-alpha-glucosidase
MGPVRVGNQAYEQVQNDVYGAVVLARNAVLFRPAAGRAGTAENFERLEELGERAIALYDQPDAGIWEYRGRQRVHTFSSIMCWAGCDRLAKIARRSNSTSGRSYWRDAADRMHADICERPGMRSAKPSPMPSAFPNSTPAC